MLFGLYTFEHFTSFFLHRRAVLTSFGTLLKIWPQFAPRHYDHIFDAVGDGRFAFNYGRSAEEGEGQ